MEKNTNVIDVEAKVVEEELLAKDLIQVIQVPEVEYSKLKQFNTQIEHTLAKLDLENLVANEENLKEIKTTRTEIRKSLKSLEDSRKLTEKTILKPYKDFEKQYNELIKAPLQKADKDLKTKVDSVENDMRKEKTKQFEDLFNEQMKEAKINFVKFEDMGLNVQISTPDSTLEKEVENYVTNIKNEIALIDTLENKERVLVQYMKTLDLSGSVVMVNNAIKQEEELKAKAEAELKAKQEYMKEVEEKQKELEEKQKELEKPITKQVPKTNIESIPEEERILKIKFTAAGTKTQLINLREFMKEQGIRYE